MKGKFFEIKPTGPTEWLLEVQGEKFNQNQTVGGTLGLKNSTGGPMSLFFVYADLKKIRSKTDTAIKWAKPVELKAVGQDQWTWALELTKDAPITDNVNSPYLFFGPIDLVTSPQDWAKMGHLQLIVGPLAEIQFIGDSLSTQQRFVFKYWKYSKGRVDAKFDPPDSRAYMMVDHLILGFEPTEAGLALTYQFAIKDVGKKTTTKKQIEQSFERREYVTASGRWNHEWVEARLKEAVDSVASKVVFT